MTVLSKLQTLIEYAKLGMFLCKYQNNEAGELFFPRAFKSYYADYNKGYQKLATAIRGHIQKFTGGKLLLGNELTEIVDLPKLMTISDSAFASAPALKICKLSSMRSIPSQAFNDDPVLEYVEVGALTSMHTNTFMGTHFLKEFCIGKGTTSSVYLQYCDELTQDCLHSIIENHADMTGTTGCLLHIGEVNIAKIDEDHIKMLSEKNISYK